VRSYLELIEKWEIFLKTNPLGSLEAFGAYLVNNGAEKSSNEVMTDYFKAISSKYGFQDLDAKSSFLFYRMQKFGHIQVKPIFDKLGINNIEEFAILSQIDVHKECSKKVVIKENLIEMSTGIDMIKRLVAKGYILQRINPKDKRETLIRLSEKGKKKLNEIYREFATTPDMLIDISDKEKIILVDILDRLDKAHTKLM
jgi:DNA-binding MarR family transcriptional regulator